MTRRRAVVVVIALMALVTLSAVSAGAQTSTTTTTASTPIEEPDEPDSVFDLWNNYRAVAGFIVGVFALIGAASRSLTVGAWSGYIAFLYIAFETQTTLFLNVGIATLVLVFLGFAFKLIRLEFEGES